MKKFSALLICLLMIITCGLAGCATFSIDKVKYYNEVLATVDETKITRFDLLTAYNSYGNSYFVQQQGQTEEEALLSTLDLLIERESLYQYALDNDDLYRPTEYQVNEIVKEIFDSVDSQLNTYVENAKTILNIESEEKPAEESESSKEYKFEDYVYSPRAVVNYEVKTRKVYYTDATYLTKTDEITEFVRDEKYNDYYIEYITEKEEESYEKLIDEQYLTNFTAKNIINEIKAKYFEHFLDELELNEKENATVLYNKARTMFAKDLINYEYYLRDSNNKPYDTVSENLFTRYFERTFKSQIQSQYLENIRTHYLKNEELSIELLKEEYSYLATINYNLYNNNHSAYKDKMKSISTDGDSVLYHPTTDTQFGYFIHTLISFDSIKDNLTKLEEFKGDKDTEYQNIISSISVKPRVYDEETKTYKEDDSVEAVSLSKILEEYNLIKNGSFDSEDQKISAFIDFMFKYTSDTATLSAGMPYVVGTNGYSSMVEEFTNEAILLMTGENADGEKVLEGKPGNMSNANINDIDSLCITEYGIHLLYYIGDVNTFDIAYSDSSNIYIQTDNKTDEDNFNLYTKIINPLTKETYFDMMFDLVYPASSGEVYSSNNGYTKYEESLTELSKKTHKVTKYTEKIKATKTTLD